MKTIKKSQCQCHHCDHADRTQCSGPQCKERVRQPINAARAARAGTAQMTLNDWQDVELEMKESLQSEHTQK